jgi:hypothetical protein
MKQHFQTAIGTLSKQTPAGGNRRLILRLQRVDLGLVQATGFDLHLTTNPNREFNRTDDSFIGSIALFRHLHKGNGGDAHKQGGQTDMDESFDVSKAASAMGSSSIDQPSLLSIE